MRDSMRLVSAFTNKAIVAVIWSIWGHGGPGGNPKSVI